MRYGECFMLGPMLTRALSVPPHFEGARMVFYDGASTLIPVTHLYRTTYLAPSNSMEVNWTGLAEHIGPIK